MAKTITREEFNRMTAGIGVPVKKASKVADLEKVKAKAMKNLRDFTMSVKIENEDGTTSNGKIKPYANLSFQELGNVKVTWTNKDGVENGKEYPAVKFDNGRVLILKGWYYQGVVPVEGIEGLYTFK